MASKKEETLGKTYSIARQNAYEAATFASAQSVETLIKQIPHRNKLFQEIEVRQRYNALLNDSLSDDAPLFISAYIEKLRAFLLIHEKREYKIPYRNYKYVVDSINVRLGYLWEAATKEINSKWCDWIIPLTNVRNSIITQATDGRITFPRIRNINEIKYTHRYERLL